MRVKSCRDVRFVRPLNLHKNHLQEQKFFYIFAEIIKNKYYESRISKYRI